MKLLPSKGSEMRVYTFYDIITRPSDTSSVRLNSPHQTQRARRLVSRWTRPFDFSMPQLSPHSSLPSRAEITALFIWKNQIRGRARNIYGSPWIRRGRVTLEGITGYGWDGVGKEGFEGCQECRLGSIWIEQGLEEEWRCRRGGGREREGEGKVVNPATC